MKRIVFIICFAALAFNVQAQMVGATNRQQGGFISSDPSPLYRPTGPSIRFSIGAAPLVSVAYNHQLTPWFMVGGGVGLCFVNGTEHRYNSGTEVYSLREKGGIPLFVEAEVRTPRYKWSFFVDTKLGYILNAPEDRIERGIDTSYEWNRILFSLTAGASYKNVSLGLGYAYTEGFNLQLSYNLPVSVITSKLL